MSRTYISVALAALALTGCGGGVAASISAESQAVPAPAAGDYTYSDFLEAASEPSLLAARIAYDRALPVANCDALLNCLSR